MTIPSPEERRYIAVEEKGVCVWEGGDGCVTIMLSGLHPPNVVPRLFSKSGFEAISPLPIGMKAPY